MSDWYRVTLSVRDVAQGRGVEMQNHFEKAFIAAGAPKDAAMFKGADVMSNDYYFSPAAASLAKPLMVAYRGEVCVAPKRSEVHGLVERDGAENVPFAD